MNPNQLWLITQYSFTEIWRNRTFGIAFLILIPLIIAYQLSFQSDIFNLPVEYTLVLPSFIPTQNAYLFNLLQVFPLATMGFWVHKQKKCNTLEALLVHPQGNGTHSAGSIIGIIGAFILMGGLSLSIAGLINLFASPTGFRPLIYLFYLVTLFLPTVIFIVGMTSLLSARYLKNSTTTTLFMLIYLGVDILYLSKLYHGILDPLGILLPYTFSDFTGIADLSGFLLHRMTFFLMGIGFSILTISGFPRIPNKVNERQLTGIVGLLFLFAGILSGYTGYNHHQQKEYHQALYKSTYNKYVQNTKLNITTHEIRFAYREKQAHMESRITLRNSTASPCPEIILYLNPSLKVTSIQEHDKPISFTRDAQVIMIPYPVSPEDSITLDIYYRGTIDESICYLNIPEKQKEFDIDNRHYLSCRFGHRYAFLEKNYTLLTPECLWYPVSSPPINPSCPYNTQCDYTRYTLTVDHPTQLTAISQGSDQKTKSGTRFENEHPQRNISLCIGNYEKRAIKVDNVNYELYMSQNNFEILTPIEQKLNSLPAEIRDIKEIIEYERKSSYPFSRLRLIETPITFTSHYHPTTGGSEMVQPEIFLFPERGISILNGRIRPFTRSLLRFDTFTRSPFKSIIHWKLNHEHITTNWETGTLSHLKLSVSWDYNHMYNIFDFNPLFFNHIHHIHSSEYPTTNEILNQPVKRPWENRDPMNAITKSHQEALNYLNGKSYREALADNTLSFDVINQINELKANDLFMQVILKGVPAANFHQFVQNFMKQNRFQQTNFQTFDNAFFEKFGWQLSEIFPMYFNQRELPAFRVKNFRKKRILSPSEKEGDPWTPHSKFNIEFDVLNESDVNGVISLYLESIIIPKGEDPVIDRNIYTPRSFAVKAREAKKIIFIYEGIPNSQSIHTGLSKNRPNMFKIYDEVFLHEKKTEYTTDSIAREEPIPTSIFFPPANEIIVDNKDSGFHIINPPAPWLSRILGIENEHHHISFFKAVSHWESQVSTDYFGGYNQSAVGKATRKGKAALTWTTPIDKKGKYKIYAYIPNNSYREEVRRTRWSDNPIRDIQYYYSISYKGSSKKDVKVHAPETSKWVFLGEFMLPEGKCSVTLYDIGLPGQCVVGDAIKWVYQKP